MAALNKLLSSVLLAVLYASWGNAAPKSAGFKHSTHNVRDLGNGIKLTAYHPASKYTTFGEGRKLEASFAPQSLEAKTVSFVSSELNIDADKVTFGSGYSLENGQSFGYARQLHENISFANAVANVAFHNDKLVAFGSSFVQTDKIADSKPTIELDSVLGKVEELLQAKKTEHEPTLQYLALPDGSAALVYSFQVSDVEKMVGYQAYVDAHSGELLSVNDFISHATYRVLPIGKYSPLEGLELLKDPQVSDGVSPNGWHSGTGKLTTAGNNVVAFRGFPGSGPSGTDNTTVESSAGVFDYSYDLTQYAETTININAARVQAFYLANTFHDVLYRYGFTEQTWNFQTDNFGKGGKGNDPMQMAVQYFLSGNNAAASTPPDGTPGWTYTGAFFYTKPTRDSIFENDIPLHELGHGLTGRITGGGTAKCLDALEGAGLGEGWSDAIAEWFQNTVHEELKDFISGQWVLNDPLGVRHYPYSTSTSVNPLLYSHMATLEDPHDLGELWGNTLHNVYAALIKEHGWSPNARNDPTTSHGNVVFLRHLVDGLSLQPCNPTYINARDAWIQADANRYGGANKCLLWKVFASKGLGVGAANFVDSFEVPEGC